MIPRLYVDAPLHPGAEIVLDADRAHYLRDVLRREPGATVDVFNGSDGEWRTEVSALRKKAANLRCIERRREQDATARDAPWLIFAPLKRNQTDLLVQKATELGVSVMQPVTTRYAQADRINPDRLGKIATEAAEQSERLDVPAVRDLRPLTGILDGWPGDRALIACAEAGPAHPIADVLGNLYGQPLAVLTGPEGGFSPDELAILSELPFCHAVSLGPRILKAETAAIAALAVLQALAGDGAAERPRFPRQ